MVERRELLELFFWHLTIDPHMFNEIKSAELKVQCFKELFKPQKHFTIFLMCGVMCNSLEKYVFIRVHRKCSCNATSQVVQI